MRRAGYQLVVDGRDVSDLVGVRLVSLNLSERRAGEADTLQVRLQDTDGRLSIPAEKAVITLALGWLAGPGPIGLVPKGRFILDEVEHEGPPDTLQIKARSADFTADLTTVRDRAWSDATLGQVLTDIAGRNGLSPRVDQRLAGVALAHLEQSRESDAALLARLGRRFDAVATVKAGALVFLPAGAGRAASGTAITPAEISRDMVSRHRWRRADRQRHDGAEAQWHDVASGQRRLVQVGAEGRRRRLRTIYGTEAEARQAAEAATSRASRADRGLLLTLAAGRPDIGPERPVRVSGFKAAIDATGWVVDAADHVLDAGGGLRTDLTLEPISQEPNRNT
jgi:phage protein D